MLYPPKPIDLNGFRKVLSLHGIKVSDLWNWQMWGTRQFLFYKRKLVQRKATSYGLTWQTALDHTANLANLCTLFTPGSRKDKHLISRAVHFLFVQYIIHISCQVYWSLRDWMPFLWGHYEQWVVVPEHWMAGWEGSAYESPGNIWSQWKRQKLFGSKMPLPSSLWKLSSWQMVNRRAWS